MAGQSVSPWEDFRASSLNPPLSLLLLLLSCVPPGRAAIEGLLLPPGGQAMHVSVFNYISWVPGLRRGTLLCQT